MSHTPLLDATEASLAAATHLTEQDAGAVEGLRALARKIDAWDVIVAWAIEDQVETGKPRPAVPQNDNVSLACYLKYADALGLVPGGRKASPAKPEAEPKAGGALASVSGIPRPA